MSNFGLISDPAFRGDVPVRGPEPEFEETGVRGRWPRLIHLEKGVEERLSLWLDEEIENHLTERQPLLEQYNKHQEQYWAEPEQKQKDFPFTKAANIVVPLTAIAVEAIHARLMNTLFGVNPFWSMRPRSKEWIEHVKPLERYIQTEAENQETLDVYGFANESLIEFIKLGTGVAKSGYKREIKKSLRAFGDDEEPYYYESYNGATLERVPLSNFMMRLAESNPQTASWVGEYHRTSWSQIKRMTQSSRFFSDAAEKIKTWWIDSSYTEAGQGTEYRDKTRELAKMEPVWSDEFDFYEIWCSFDVDEDGWDEEIILDYHKPSKTFLSIRYNWYADLHRPYRIGTFLPVEGIWAGIGVAKQNEQLQEEVTTIHRQRLDNATLANMAQIVLAKNTGYGPGEPIFPGKMWFVDDPQRDIKEFKLSEVYASSYANEESVVRYSEKRTGVNEVILGLQPQGTPGTATGDLARIAEGNKRFDLVLKSVRRWYSQIGQDVTTNYQQFGNQQMHWLILGEEGQYVEEVLTLPPDLVSRGVAVDLTVTDSITNRDVEQRQWMSLFQVITNFYQQALGLSQMIAQLQGDPTILLQIASRALVNADEALKRLLETFNTPDTDRFTLSGGDDGSQPGVGPTGEPLGGGEGGPEPAGLISGVAGTPEGPVSSSGGPSVFGPGV